MEARDVLDVLAILQEAGVTEVWLDGGWGIDALLGGQERDHQDLDLVVPVEDVPRTVSTLGEVGFEVEVDARPTSMTVVDRAGRRVDLHPIRIDDRGNGWRAGAAADGSDARYPKEGFTTGWVGGQTVGCVGPQVQIDHHLGYEPTARDREDVVRLCDRFTLPLPDEYK